MLCRKWLSYRCLSLLWMLLLLLAAAACTDSENGAPSSWVGVCIDQDQDGFGVECANGPDCNDQDAKQSTECGCSVAAEGCSCEANAEPRPCVISREHTGT